MSEMVERVARALCREIGVPEDALIADSSGDIARAAIAAMREPTEEMIDEAWSFIGSNLRYEEVYRRMIDRALK